jgi:hypothetical protein
MLIKHALITALVTWLIILGAALGLAVHRNDVSVKSIIEYAWGVSFAVCILGVLFSSDASTGDTIERTEGVENHPSIAKVIGRPTARMQLSASRLARSL